MKRPEQTIQIAVVQHLYQRPAAGVFFFHVPNGGRKSPQMGAIHKALGVVAGVPDIVALKAGEIFGLELKSAKGRLLPSQRLVHAAMQEAGAKTAVAYSLDEALYTLEGWGILRRAA